MNLVFKKIGIFWALLSGLWASCAREITIDLPEENPKTVVICHFKSGEPLRMTLSRSQPVFDGNDFQQITEGDVSLSVNGKYWDKLTYRYDADSEKWLWRTKRAVEPRDTYTLSVKLPIPGEPDITGSSSTPLHFPLRFIEIDRENIRTVTLPDGSQARRVPMLLQLSGLPSSERYFGFYLTYETEVFSEKNNQIVLDYSYQAKASFTSNGRTLSLLHDLSRLEKLVLINENYWSDNLGQLRLDVILPLKSANEFPRKIFVEWRTLSAEFYRYHLSVARQSINNPLNDPDAVFNNIQNGYGNFSGYSISRDTLKI